MMTTTMTTNKIIDQLEVDNDYFSEALDKFFTLTEQTEEEPQTSQVRSLKEGRQSRFWFRAFEDEVSQIEKTNSKKTKVENQELDNISKHYQKEVPKRMTTRLEQARSFIMNEIVTHSLALAAASTQAKIAINRISEESRIKDVDFAIFSKLEQMNQQAMLIKVAKFIQDYYELPEDSYKALISSRGQNQNSELEKLVKQLVTTRHNEKENL